MSKEIEKWRKVFEKDTEERDKLEESIRVNKKLIKQNPGFGLLNERVLYDKEFLLEVQSAGYNPLDKEDVKNFIENKPPKNIERNLILAGVDKFTSLGQSEYKEDFDISWAEKNNIPLTIKTPNDIYLSELPSRLQNILLENVDNTELMSTLNNKELKDEFNKERESEPQPTNINQLEDKLRKNIASVFGSNDYGKNFIQEEGLVKKGSNGGDILELIKELKALGFSNEEIKKEVQKRL